MRRPGVEPCSCLAKQASKSHQQVASSLRLIMSGCAITSALKSLSNYGTFTFLGAKRRLWIITDHNEHVDPLLESYRRAFQDIKILENLGKSEDENSLENLARISRAYHRERSFKQISSFRTGISNLAIKHRSAI
ncbi:hypothetical protein HN011_001317 [Eciton burchellii]|nr:hypothetical protein HN011_001317 [Eciton burchellii]